MKCRRTLIVDLAELSAADLCRVGGKAVALARLLQAGLPVPGGVCVTTEAYDSYLDTTGLRRRLPLLLERKAFSEMRWEELWDLALRVRNLFLTTPIPEALASRLGVALARRFTAVAATVRSSAPAEDSAKASFAGLHDSFVNVRGLPALLDRVRLVWASLWSDRALLYRQELGLDPAASAMAVVVQELVVGECSGVAFSRCPGREKLAAIEVVWGLNQGLVDGDVAPDRLLLDRQTGVVVERHAPLRERACRATPSGTSLLPLTAEERAAPPLNDAAAGEVMQLLVQAESVFGRPQDLEWTRRNAELFALQSRPITTAAAEGGSERAWYLSLHRSLASLKELRRVIEEELLPALKLEAARLEATELATLDDTALAEAFHERLAALTEGEARYREICIPMAHGMRLFGQVYNDRLHPADPFAFLDLLSGDAGLLAVQRNRELLRLAGRLRSDPSLAAIYRAHGTPPAGNGFAAELAAFTERFGDLSAVLGDATSGSRGLSALLLEMAARPTVSGETAQPADETAFLAVFSAEEQDYARDLLDIGRASYRLRDNDNLALGRLSACLQAVREEVARRLATRHNPELAGLLAGNCGPVARRLTPPAANGESRRRDLPGARLQARQLVGQPAGPGIGQGRARVIIRTDELAAFQSGDILVCDAVDPNMTFVVPLAAGIVERRGGMLIHGAIIAREYGLPCVTGVPEATTLIHTGDRLTVDGYLGVVIVSAAGQPEGAP